MELFECGAFTPAGSPHLANHDSAKEAISRKEITLTVFTLHSRIVSLDLCGVSDLRDELSFSKRLRILLHGQAISADLRIALKKPMGG